MRAHCMSLVGLFSLSLFSGFAQAPATGTDRHIVLDVVVTDKSGKPVSGLQQQDFTLLDNKQPRKIDSFEAAAASDPPVEIVFLVDEVNTDFTHVSFARAQIEKFLRSNGGELPRPASLAVLSDSGVALGNLTTQDGNALAGELNQSKAGLRSITRSQGIYGANDRVGLSLNSLEELANYEAPRPGRKLVIWISPGWPLLSEPEHYIERQRSAETFQPDCWYFGQSAARSDHALQYRSAGNPRFGRISDFLLRRVHQGSEESPSSTNWRPRPAGDRDSKWGPRSYFEQRCDEPDRLRGRRCECVLRTHLLQA